MGFISNLLGTNQKINTGRLGREYDSAYRPATKAYEQLQGTAQDMMDMDSDYNQNQRAMMEAQGADRAAEAARMGQRMASMAGGAPAGALAAQAMGTQNKAMADSQAAYNQYLVGAQDRGMGLLSSSANNLSKIAGNRMNMMNSARQANAQIDSQAAGGVASLLGTGLGLASSAFGGPAGGAAASGFLKMLGIGKQKGGYIKGYQEGDVVSEGAKYAKQYKYAPSIVQKMLDNMPYLGGKRAYERARDYIDKVHFNPKDRKERDRLYKNVMVEGESKRDIREENDRTTKNEWSQKQKVYSQEDPRVFGFRDVKEVDDMSVKDKYIAGNRAGHLVETDDMIDYGVDEANIAKYDVKKGFLGLPKYSGSIEKNEGMNPFLNIKEMQKGGMISHMMGPNGYMKIPTRIAGRKVG